MFVNDIFIIVGRSFFKSVFKNSKHKQMFINKCLKNISEGWGFSEKYNLYENVIQKNLYTKFPIKYALDSMT